MKLCKMIGHPMVIVWKKILAAESPGNPRYRGSKSRIFTYSNDHSSDSFEFCVTLITFLNVTFHGESDGVWILLFINCSRVPTPASPGLRKLCYGPKKLCYRTGRVPTPASSRVPTPARPGPRTIISVKHSTFVTTIVQI